jgi:site-specific DNA-cytosine methylase
LLSGIKVNRYLYVDIDPLARDIAKFRVANLSAKFPDLFPPSAWEHAFALPHDINAIRDYQLDHLLAGTPQQILLMAGWPCQEYSPAGKGKPGPMAAILDRVIHIIARLQALQPEHPVAYLLENVAIHENFMHKHIRTEVADEVVSKIGTPVTFDAADVGSYATRVRSYWTNLASQLSMKLVYDHLRTPQGYLYDILEPGRHPMPVENPPEEVTTSLGKSGLSCRRSCHSEVLVPSDQPCWQHLRQSTEPVPGAQRSGMRVSHGLRGGYYRRARGRRP